PIIVVVSAFPGVTNQLVDCARLAERGDSTYERTLQDIARRHRSAVARLIGRRSRVQAGTEQLLTELRDTLHGIFLLRHCPLQALDMTRSFGELLSALIVAAHLNKRHPAIFVDSRTFVVTAVHFPQQ